MKWNKLSWTTTTLTLAIVASSAAAQDDPCTNQKQPPVVGRWDLTVHGPQGDYPSWLEVRQSGYRTLVGSFVGRTGSARPISLVEFDKADIHFSMPPQLEKRTDLQHIDGQLEGDVLRGETTNEEGRRIALGSPPRSLPQAAQRARTGATQSSYSTAAI